ncbi:phosphoserine transaminase [Malassezia psittaci]|uniref:phosphoserine transaminase n=1 Tax=Malassezia psittaci TaxID=1821823 RepID=A0AAF0FE54_9BASI|nr:phosphoserine transaminase [Malassezia psittaci]
MSLERESTINLGAGPSALPTSVLQESTKALLNFNGLGMGITEISHRSSAFQKVIRDAENDIRQLLSIPDDYAVLFLQGGGTEQFSAIVLNMLAAHAARNPSYEGTPPVDYLVTGSWSSKAMKEAQRLTKRVNMVADLRPSISDADVKITPPEQWALSPVEEAPVMLHYCDNETIGGFEMPSNIIQQLPEKYREQVPIVADCSSNILSRPIDIRAHAAIYFGVQKNIGPSGLAMAIVRRDLVVDSDKVSKPYVPSIPTSLLYKNAMDNGSLYNTPPMFPIYVSGLVFRDLVRLGGVTAAQQRAASRSEVVYGALLSYPALYRPVVQHAEYRSQMNITFRILDPATQQPSPELEASFAQYCSDRHIFNIKGHRSVGGLRASLYNAITQEQAETFANVTREFAKQHISS